MQSYACSLRQALISLDPNSALPGERSHNESSTSAVKDDAHPGCHASGQRWSYRGMFGIRAHVVLYMNTDSSPPPVTPP